VPDSSAKVVQRLAPLIEFSRTLSLGEIDSQEELRSCIFGPYPLIVELCIVA
jgi:hypothetical protein